MTDRMPQIVEICIVTFAFSEKKGYKFRPAIVMDVLDSSQILVAMITGAGSKISLPHDVLLADWKVEGLNKPSLARLDKVAIVDKALLGQAGCIGRLSERDERRVFRMFEEIEEGSSEG